MIDSGLAAKLRKIGASSVLEPLLRASRLGVIDLKDALARFATERGAGDRIVFLKTQASDARSSYRLSLIPEAGEAILWLDDAALGGCFELAKGARLVLEHGTATFVGKGEPWQTLDGPVKRPLDDLIVHPVLNNCDYVIDSYVARHGSAGWVFDVPRIEVPR